MGCVNKRETSDEEDAIIEAEELLGFQRLNTDLIVSALTNHSIDNSLNDIQLEKTLSSLGLSLWVSDGKVSTISFLNKLKGFDQTYSLTHWQLVGIFLGKEKDCIKASDIFHLFADTKNIISMNNMKNTVLKSLIQISISLGYLVTIKKEKSKNEIQVLSYLEQLETIETIAVNKVAERMLYGSTDISEDVFVDVMTSFRRGALLTTTGWRSFLKYIYTNNWRNQAWANPYSNI